MRQPVLTTSALEALRHVRPQLLDAAAGRMSERLVLVTVGAAVRLARREAQPGEVLPKRVVDLVCESLKDLAHKKWKPDTMLSLDRRHGKGRHGLSQ
jgi:hypothetical protein